MRTKSFQALLIAILISGVFANSTNIYGQPAPDLNFCSVKASLIFGDSVCRVTGGHPIHINYDDGSAEDYALWVELGGMSVVRFTPPGYQLSLVSGELYVGDGSFPIGADFLGTDFKVVVFDDDGPDGFPGTMIDSVIVTVEDYGWVSFNLPEIMVEEGDYYLGMKQLGVPPYAAPVGIDTDIPTIHRSYIKQAGGEWELSPYQDFMIRSYVCNTQSVDKNSDRRSLPFEFARITDFDPNLGEVPEDGVLSVIGESMWNWYYDSTWFSLTDRFYAYAIRIKSEDTATTGWYYSNIMDKSPDGINDDKLRDLKIYPNPADDVLHIESSVAVESISLINILGKQVFVQSGSLKEISISTNQMEAGIYFVKTKTVTGSSIRKVLIR